MFAHSFGQLFYCALGWLRGYSTGEAEETVSCFISAMFPRLLHFHSLVSSPPRSQDGAAVTPTLRSGGSPVRPLASSRVLRQTSRWWETDCTRSRTILTQFAYGCQREPEQELGSSGGVTRIRNLFTVIQSAVPEYTKRGIGGRTPLTARRDHRHPLLLYLHTRVREAFAVGLPLASADVVYT